MAGAHQPLVSLIDKSLSREDFTFSDFKKNLILTLQVDVAGFSYCISEEERNRHLAIESYRFDEPGNPDLLCQELSRKLDNIENIKRRFQHVHLLFETPKHTLLPVSLFKEQSAIEILSFHHTLKSDEVVLSEKMPNLDAFSIMAVPKCLREMVRSRYVNGKLLHVSYVLIESLLMIHKNLEVSDQVFVNVRKGNIDLICIEGRDLKFSNSFSYKTPEDFIYFVLYAFEQLKFNPETTQLIFLGEIERNHENFEIAQKYIRNIRFMERNDHFKYSYVFDDLAPQAFFTLFNSAMCV